MKRIQILALGMAGFVSVLVSGQLQAQETNVMQAFMRQKLAYSQNIIEGLALERQDMVLTNAAKLIYMTRSNAWMELKTSGYLEQTRKFQDDVILLGNEARARSSSGMLQAYVKVTSGCIECHQAFRPAQATNMLSARTVLEAAPKPSAPAVLDKSKPKK